MSETSKIQNSNKIQTQFKENSKNKFARPRGRPRYFAETGLARCVEGGAPSAWGKYLGEAYAPRAAPGAADSVGVWNGMSRFEGERVGG